MFEKKVLVSPHTAVKFLEFYMLTVCFGFSSNVHFFGCFSDVDSMDAEQTGKVCNRLKVISQKKTGEARLPTISGAGFKKHSQLSHRRPSAVCLYLVHPLYTMVIIN